MKKTPPKDPQGNPQEKPPPPTASLLSPPLEPYEIMDSRPLVGISLMVTSMLFFALTDGAIKAAAPAVSGGQMILWLGLGGFIVFLALCIVRGEAPFEMTFFNPTVMLRNLAEAVGSAGIVIAVTLVPLTTVGAIHQSVPLIVTLGAVVFLKESVGWRRWLAILAGFGFVMLILKPGTGGFDPNFLFAVAAAIGLSVRDLATRGLRIKISTLQLSVFATLTLIPVGAIIAFIETRRGIAFVIPSGIYLIYVLLALVFSIVAYVTITAATRTSALSVVAPWRYSRMLFALMMGMIIFGERPDALTLIGAAGIVGSGLFLLMRERKK